MQQRVKNLYYVKRSKQKFSDGTIKKQINKFLILWDTEYRKSLEWNVCHKHLVICTILYKCAHNVNGIQQHQDEILWQGLVKTIINITVQ
jgi:hypothetical protein